MSLSLGQLYAVTGVLLIYLALAGLILRPSLLHRILSLNIMGSGVFLVYVAAAYRPEGSDPVAHAMVLTGIVVAVSTTALAITLGLRLRALDGADE